MTACPEKTELLHAYFDGELDAANAQALEDHLKACAICREGLAELQSLRGRLGDPNPLETAPPALRRKIEAMLEPASLLPRGGILPGSLAGAFGAIAATMAAVAIIPSTGALEAQLVADHVRATFGTRLVDVETSDRHTVKPWFNGKVDFAPPVADLADAGFPLVGGRLDYAEKRPIAALVYRRNRHVIDLFVWPAERGFRWPAFSGAHAGYGVVHWTEGGLQFWAVSDVDRGDLAAFSRAYQARTHP